MVVVLVVQPLESVRVAEITAGAKPFKATGAFAATLVTVAPVLKLTTNVGVPPEGVMVYPPSAAPKQDTERVKGDMLSGNGVKIARVKLAVQLAASRTSMVKTPAQRENWLMLPLLTAVKGGNALAGLTVKLSGAVPKAALI